MRISQFNELNQQENSHSPIKSLRDKKSKICIDDFRNSK